MVGNGKQLTFVYRRVVGEQSVELSTQEPSVGTEVRIPAPAEVADFTEQSRIYEHTLAGAESRGRAGYLDYADSLVANDPRHLHWDLAVHDAQISAAQPECLHANDR